MKEFLKKHKSSICSLLVALLIFGLMVLIIYFSNEDKKKLIYTNNIDIQENDILYKNEESPTLFYNLFNNSIVYAMNYENEGTNFIIDYDYRDYINITRYTSQYDFNNNNDDMFDSILENEDYDSNYWNIYIAIGQVVDVPLIFNLDNTNLDTIISLYNNETLVGVFERTFDSYSIFVNQEQNLTYNIIKFDSLYKPDYMTFSFNISSNGLYYLMGYNSRTDEVNALTYQLNYLHSAYDTLDFNYSTLLDQYNLLSQNDYTFSELFWSISAVPFGVLTSAFNVNVLGVNLAGVVTGLITSLILLWLIKRLFK